MRAPIRSAVITGGANGIGRQMALVLASDGAKIVVADRDEQAARETARQVVARGGEALVVACDVSDDADVARLADEAWRWLKLSLIHI